MYLFKKFNICAHWGNYVLKYLNGYIYCIMDLQFKIVLMKQK